MKVKYKYHGESPVIVPDGDSYTIEFSRIDHQNYYQAIGTYAHISSGETRAFASTPIKGDAGTIEIWDDYSRKPWAIVHPLYGNDTVGKHFIYEVQGDAQTFFNNYPTFHSSANRPVFFYTGEYIVNRSVYTLNNIYSPNPNDTEFRRFQGENPQILFWHPVTYTPRYELKIFQNGVLIYTRVEEYEPEYVVIIPYRECPPNTCPVQCNQNVCCYGSDGIATETFLFSESAYQ